MAEIKTISYTDTLLKDVIVLGDSNSSTLGHFPRKAFEEQARKGLIMGIVQNGKLCGYLMYRFVQSTKTIAIVHFCIDNPYRNKGFGKSLMDELKRKFKNTCRGIKLNCRDDYKHATKFWRDCGFIVKSQKRSRSIKENTLNIWWYDFEMRDLFCAKEEFEVVTTSVLLDFNIIIKHHTENDKNQEVEYLFEDWLINDVTYFVSKETYNEVIRDKDLKRRERNRKFLNMYPQLKPKEGDINKIYNEISLIIKGNSENDRSDKRQVSEAVSCNIRYLITLDQGLLKYSDDIFNTYGLNILTPAHFITEVDSLINNLRYVPKRLAGANYTISKPNVELLKTLTDEFLCKDSSERKTEFSNNISLLASDTEFSELFVIQDSEKNVLAFMGYKLEPENLNIKYIRIKKESISNYLFKQIILNTITLAVRKNKLNLLITDKYLSFEQEEILYEYKFIKDDNRWLKICLNGITSSLELIQKFPILKKFLNRDVYNNILENHPNNSKADLLLELEKMFWPLKFTDLEIPTFIIPIKPSWASELFDYETAETTIPGSNAILSWNRENVYYRSVKPNIEVISSRILWYTSTQKGFNKSKNIIATSYLDEIFTGKVKNVFGKFKKFGIYQWKEVYSLAKKNVENEIKAIKFSNTEVFSKPISLRQVNAILNKSGQKSNTFQCPVKTNNEVFIDMYTVGKEL